MPDSWRDAKLGQFGRTASFWRCPNNECARRFQNPVALGGQIRPVKVILCHVRPRRRLHRDHLHRGRHLMAAMVEALSQIVYLHR